jgi:hypothetical protein
MASASKIHFLSLLILLSYNSHVAGTDYVVSQVDNMLDGGILISPSSPLTLQNGDTLIVKNGKKIQFDPSGNSSMIVSKGNNTITIDTGSSISSTLASIVARNIQVIKFDGSGKSIIEIKDGGLLQSGDVSNIATINANVFTSGSEAVTLINSGTLIGYAYFNQLSRGTNNLVLLSNTALVMNAINSTVANPGTGISNLWIGGSVDDADKVTTTATTINLNVDYYPFDNIRVFNASSLTLSTKTNSTASVLTRNLVIDENGTFTLTGAPSPLSASLAGKVFNVTNIENKGILNIANSYAPVSATDVRKIEVASLINDAGKINITNTSELLGASQVTSTFTSLLGSSITIASGLLSNFNTLENAGDISVFGTISKINTFTNQTNGNVILQSGASFIDVKYLTNNADAAFQINGATFSTTQELVIKNYGIFVMNGGTLAMKQFENYKTYTINSGNFDGYSLSGANVTNKLGAIMYANGGAIKRIDDFNNYGRLDLDGMTVETTVDNFNNYGVVNHSKADLQPANFYNKKGAAYNLSGADDVLGAGSLTPNSSAIINNAIFNVNTTGDIHAILYNAAEDASDAKATFVIKALGSVYEIVNDGDFKIGGAVTISSPLPALAPANTNQSITNNSYCEITAATLTLSNQIYNAPLGVMDITGNLTLNFATIQGAFNDVPAGPGRYSNFTNDGVLNFKTVNGTITYAGANSNVLLSSSDAVVQVYYATTLENASYANSGFHRAYINSADENASVFRVDGNANLQNCTIDFEVNRSLTGDYVFTLINSQVLTNQPNDFMAIDTFLIKKNVASNNSIVVGKYYRRKLTDLNLTENAMKLAQAIEDLLIAKQFADENLNALYQNMYQHVSSEKELEAFLTNMLPIVSLPMQNAVVQSTVNHHLDMRMQNVRASYNSADYESGFIPWVKYFSTFNRQSKNMHNIGYRFKSRGLVLGLDHYDGVLAQYGASMTFANSWLEQYANIPSKSSTQIYQANIYGQHILDGKYYTSWVIGLSYSATKQSRVDANDNGAVALSHYSWQQYFAKYEFGHVFNLYNQHFITPFIAVNYTFLKNYQYQEYNNAPDNLFIKSPVKHLFEADLGVRMSTEWLLYNKMLTPKFHMGLKYFLSKPMFLINSSIIDQNIMFRTTTSLPRLKSYAGIGASLELIRDVELSFNTDLEMQNDYLGLSYSILLRYIF